MVARNPQTPDDPSDGHADLFVTIPRKASALWESSRVLFEAHREVGMPARQSPFATPFTYYSRCFWTGTTVPTWRDPAKNARSRALFQKVMDRCAEHGWVSYRTNPAFQDLLISKYSFNNNSLLRFQEKLKDSIDPNGIIVAGPLRNLAGKNEEEPRMRPDALSTPGCWACAIPCRRRRLRKQTEKPSSISGVRLATEPWRPRMSCLAVAL